MNSAAEITETTETTETTKSITWVRAATYYEQSLCGTYRVAAYNCNGSWLFRPSKRGAFIGGCFADAEQAKQLCLNNFMIEGDL